MIAGKDYAKKAAKKIFGCYPDYAKAPAEYLLNFVGVLAGMETRIVDELVVPSSGLPSKCAFLPTIADMTSMAAGFEIRFASEDRAKAEALARAQEEEDRQKRPRSGTGTDGKKCPPGCEMVVKDEAWWAGRSAKLEAARKFYPHAVMDNDGWLIKEPASKPDNRSSFGSLYGESMNT